MKPARDHARALERALTEQRNPASERLDEMSTLEIVDLMNDQDRQVPAAVRAATRRLSKILNAPDWKTWAPDEQESFRRLSVLFDVIPDLESWPKRDKKALVQIMRAKGKPGETEYARRLLRHKRLNEALRLTAKI